MNGCRFPLEFFRRLNVRVADNVIREGVHLALDNGNIAARELRVDDRGSHGAAVPEIAGQKTLDAADAAV